MRIGECRGDWALVTGASSGIGREFAHQLAAAGMHVALVARRADLLGRLAGELQERNGVRAVALPFDLATPGAAQDVCEEIEKRGIRIRLLVNNAAFGRWGAFEAVDARTYADMIGLNATALVGLCHALLPHLAAHPRSAVINVSSPAGLQPVPYMAVYAATKAFVSSFSQALHGEWKERGVLVQTLVPGPTATEFDEIAGAYTSALKEQREPAQRVVADALASLARAEPVAWSARGTYKQRLFAGLFPARWVIREVARMFRPPAHPGA